MKLPRRQSPPSERTPKTLAQNDGGNVLQAIRPAPARISSPFLLNELEAGSFEFFRAESIPQTNRLADSSFWNQYVLQIAHEESAVRHGIIALGALQRTYDFRDVKAPTVAVSNYSKALNEAKDLVERATVTGDHTKVLVCALLFHCIETMLGDHVSAKTHLRGGLRLLYDKGQPGGEVGESITNTFWRLDFQAMTFWDVSAPYEFIPQTGERLRAIAVPSRFKSLNHAANNLMGLLHWMFYKFDLFPEESWLVPESHTTYLAEIKRSRASIDVWYYTFEDYKSKHGTHEIEFRQKCALLKIYYLLASIQLRHSRIEPETEWDLFLPDFIQLLDLAEEFTAAESKIFAKGVASFEVGIVIPLFETAMRCRDPIQRRRALNLLRSSNRREGVWDSIGAAAVAERAITVEEEGLGEVMKAADVPDHKRISFLYPRAELATREVQATFFVGRRLEKSETGQLYYDWTPRQEIVHF
jgi:cholestenol delta-isomerase